MNIYFFFSFSLYFQIHGSKIDEDIYPDSILNDHEIVFPIIHFGDDERVKRSTGNKITNDESRNKMNVKFKALGKKFNLDLSLNKRLLNPNFHVETYDGRGNIQHIHSMKNCFYTGRIHGESHSSASLSHCNGLKGVIQTQHEKYYIQPFQRPQFDQNSKKIRHAHIVKRMFGETERDKSKNYNSTQFLRHVTDGEVTCGINDFGPRVRWRRGVQSEKAGEQTIETMLTLDRKVAQFYGVDAAKEYALSVANVAHNILRDPSIGPNSVNLVVNKLIVLTTALPDLTINHHAQNTLSSFGKWAERRNKIEGNTNNLYDYSVLLTKHDICADKDQPCETKGFTYIGGMCDGDRSSAIVVSEGFNTAFYLAHQIGHSLGMDHDGIGNICEGSRNVMATNGGSAADAYHWSRCSRDYIQSFLRKNQSSCLNNRPTLNRRENIDVFENIGNVYDVDTQCRFALGENARACYQSDQDEICAELMCVHPEFKNCTRMKKPSMDGTKCGKNLWCKQGVCVLKGLRDDLVVDGSWGAWADHGECSRTCGGGVSYRERACNNPRPNHGGKYCEGSSREYVICSKQSCSEMKRLFRESQCESKNKSYFDDHVLNWIYNRTKELESSCQLHCQSAENEKITKNFGAAVDGTECLLADVVGRCVQGECHPVGCGLTLGSFHVEDRCGVCGGNGTTCKPDLKNNSLAVSRSEVNKDMMEKLVMLEEQKNVQVENIAKRLIQLRSIMKAVVSKKCGGDQQCIDKYVSKDIHKKDFIDAPPKRFYWVSTSSGCSVSCGEGTEKLVPECRRVDDGTRVADSFCQDMKKPNILTKACEKPVCPPRWTASDWSPCTRSCGSGRKMRNVYCSLSVGNDEYILPMDQCKQSEKPLQLMVCNHEICPPEWYTEPFGECSTTCNVGKRKRHVVCRQLDHSDGVLKNLNDSYCMQLKKPETDIICNAHNPCPGAKCGGRHTQSFGRITSPHYPGNYSNDLECVHEIQAPVNQVIQLQFESIDIPAPRSELKGIDCKGDFLRIVDGKCTEAPFKPVQKLCGNDLPSNFLSTTNNLCMKFVTDQSRVGKGFALNYTTQISDKRDKVRRYPIRDICDLQNEVITAELGVVTSPNYPENYPANEDCIVKFHSAETDGYMLKFDGFQVGQRSGIMDCLSDYIDVMYRNKKERICGSEETIPTINIPGNSFSITFHSSPFVLNKKGFVVTFVSKKYAKDYALNKQTAMNIQNYTLGFQDWQHQLAVIPSSVDNDDTAQPVSELKRKNMIARNPQVTKDKEELLNNLLQMATADPYKLGSLLYGQKYETESTTKTIKKSGIPHILPSNFTTYYRPSFFSSNAIRPNSYWSWSNLMENWHGSTNYNNARNTLPPFITTERAYSWGDKAMLPFSYSNDYKLINNDVRNTMPLSHDRKYIFPQRATDRMKSWYNTFQVPNNLMFSNSVRNIMLPTSSYDRKHELSPKSEFQYLKKSKLENGKNTLQSTSFNNNRQELSSLKIADRTKSRHDRFLYSKGTIFANKGKYTSPLTNSYNKKQTESNPYNDVRNIVANVESPTSLADDLSMFGDIREEITDYIPKMEGIDSSSTWLSNDNERSKIYNKYSTIKNPHSSYSPNWYYGTRFFPQDASEIRSSVPENTKPEIPKGDFASLSKANDNYLDHEIKKLTETTKKDSIPIPIVHRQSLVPGGNIPLSKLTPDMFENVKHSYIQSSLNNKLKNIVNRKSIVPIYKRTNSKSYHVKTTPSISNNLRYTQPPTTVAQMKPSNQPYFSPLYNMNWRASYTNPTWPIYGSQSAFSLESFPPSPWQRSFLPQMNFSPYELAMRRQYQSLPFTYFPSFGMFNNHCPPSTSFTCRDSINKQRCQTNDECYGTLCCETSCPVAKRVCLESGMNNPYEMYGPT